MTTYETMIVIGMGLWIAIALAILVGLGYAVKLLRDARAPLSRIGETVGDLRERLEPVMTHVERTSESASILADRLRRDADDMGRALRHAGESTERMIDLVEERVAEVAALMEVVQEEAEETFLGTASLLRAIRGGGRSSSAERRLARALRRVSRGR